MTATDIKLVWGPWQVGKMKAADYAEKAKIWAHGLKLVDPSIKLVSCGEEGNSQWDRTVLQELVGEVDMHSIHLYTTLGHKKWNIIEGFEYEKNVFGPAVSALAQQRLMWRGRLAHW